MLKAILMLKRYVSISYVHMAIFMSFKVIINIKKLNYSSVHTLYLL